MNDEDYRKFKESPEYLKLKERHPQIIQEHNDIVESIEKGEKERATKVTCTHIDNQVQTVSDTLKHIE